MTLKKLVVVFGLGCLACFGSTRPRGTGESTTQTVGTFGGTLFVEGATLTIPSGALSADTTITLTSSTEAAPSEFENYSPVFTIDPASATLSQPAELILDLDQEPLSAEAFLSKTGGGFEKVQSTLSGNSMTVKLLRFGKVFAASGATSGGSGGGSGGGDGGGGGGARPTFSAVQMVSPISSDETCAVHSDGRVSCWGNTNLGANSNTTQFVTRPEYFSGLTAVTSVRGGNGATCAVHTGGTVSCWGSNLSGQLGDGTTTARHSASSVSGIITAVAVDTGDATTCAVLSDQTVRCWGDNSLSQCGDGTSTSPRLMPVTVSGLSGVRQVEVGSDHACAVMTDKTLRCWGSNISGAIGPGFPTSNPTPVQVANVTGVEQVALGWSNTCVRLTDGTVRCWGAGGEGQLGDGTTIQSSNYSRSTPAPVVNLSSVVELAGNKDHFCARIGDGTVKCWGRNNAGQLGDGSADAYKNSAVTVTGLAGVVEVRTGPLHTCARLTDNSLRCWGYNAYGQLGDGTKTDSRAPVSVSF